MTRAEQLTDLLNRSFYKDAWYGPALMELLEGISAEQATARPIAAAHSIWELVGHIAAWKKSVAEWLAGELGGVAKDQNFPLAANASETAWQATIQTLKATHKKLETRVIALSDDQLSSNIPGQDFTPYYLVESIIQHDIYHAGQIAVLKKAE